MAKSNILKELANNTITLEIALSRLMIIASDISDFELQNWAKMELEGYCDKDECPPYRFIPFGNILYSGINGGLQVTGMPLPLSTLPEAIRKALSEPFKEKSNISTIVDIVEKKQNGMRRDLILFSQLVSDNTGGGIQCLEIWSSLDYLTFNRILSSLRTKLLDVFISLDKKLGNLDELDIDSSNVNLPELQQITYNIIYQDNSVKLGDKNKLDKSGILGSMSNGS